MDIKDIIAQREVSYLGVASRKPDIKVRAVADTPTEAAAADAETEIKGIVDGIAVPYNQPTNRVGWGLEQIAPGAVSNSVDGLPLMYEHKTAVGIINSSNDTDTELNIEAQIAATSLGLDVRELVRIGSVAKMSIGFIPIAGELLTEINIVDGQEQERDILTWTEIEIVEVSLVPVPAYPGTSATVRSAQPQDLQALLATTHPAAKAATPITTTERAASETKDNTTMTDNQIETLLTEVRDGLANRSGVEGFTEVRDMLDEINRKVQVQPQITTTPSADTRSAGQFLHDMLVRQDADTIREYNAINKRAAGDNNHPDVTSNDAGSSPVWVGDLTRLVNAPTPLSSFFAAKDLPTLGMNIEFAKLSNNTTQVAKQVNEGDELVRGLVSVEIDSAKVDTFGGATRLTLQAIERAGNNVDILTMNLQAQAIQIGQQKAASVRAGYAAAVAARKGTGTTFGVEKVKLKPTGRAASDFVNTSVDAAVIFANNGIAMDALIVGPTRFKEILGLTDSAGRPLFVPAGDATNAYGVANPKALTADLAGLTILLDPNAAADGKDAFANRDAFALYSSPVVQLQDVNALNLTKDISVHYYSAVANQIEFGIVPIVEAA